MFLSREQKVQKCMDEAYERLEDGEYEKALSLSAKLRKLHHTSGLEIGARALWALDRKQEAIDMLEQGIKIAPQVFILWSYLGEYYSDTGAYHKAIHAFLAARERDGSDTAERL